MTTAPTIRCSWTARDTTASIRWGMASAWALAKPCNGNATSNAMSNEPLAVNLDMLLNFM